MAENKINVGTGSVKIKNYPDKENGNKDKTTDTKNK